MPIALLVCIIILIDQLSKYYIESHMTLGMSIPVIHDMFHITYILNPGAAFGILEHKTSFFIFITFFILVITIYFYCRIPTNYRLMRFGIGMLFGGAIGNMIDRIKTGYVIDFFDFRIWPIFNIADITIVCGVFIIIYTLLFLANDEDEQQNA